jgi:ABC-type amino acid transport substrate-binding protein
LWQLPLIPASLLWMVSLVRQFAPVHSTTYETWLNGDTAGLGLPDASIYAAVPADVTVVPLETDQECAQAIAAGRTDFVAYVTSETVVDANIAAGMPVTKLDGAVYSEDLAAAFDKSSTLDTTSLRAKVDETLLRHAQRWFASPNSPTSGSQIDLTAAPNQ